MDLVEENINLVHYVAHRRYHHLKHKYEYDDIFQTGCIGLMKAVKDFDESKGTKFSTYAYICIDGAIVKMTRDDKWFGATREIRRNSNGPLSLNYTYTEEGQELINSIVDDNEQYSLSDLKLVISELPTLYKELIILYYFKGYNQTEIAEKYDIRQNTVSRYLSKALELLKEELIK